jgi:choline dehydrogenase
MATGSERFDYIIVGAGSAGCVLANRLSEDANVRVLLVEAGKSDRHPWISLPLKFRDLMTVKRWNWGYDTEPEPFLDNRSIYVPRGRVLGGSSSINGMIYSRGHPSDYDHWRQLGLAGWSHADVLPYFKKAEGFCDGETPHHGASGPLTVSKGDSDSVVHHAYLAAGKASGFPTTDDLNGPNPEGFGRCDYTIGNGRRASAARVYLRPALRRRNLTLVAGAMVGRVLFDGTRATGIAYRGGDGAERVASAEREIILSGGAYNSPHLLMLSGIGPADHLREHGIDVVFDAKNVGKNLQDHVHVGVGYATDSMKSFDSELRADRLALNVLNWALFAKGPLCSLPVGAMAYLRTKEGLAAPDIEFLMNRVNPEAHIWFPGIRKPKGGYMGCRVILLHPESRGSVGLRSADPAAKAVIRHNFLSAPHDLATLRRGLKTARDVYASEPLKGMLGNEVWPGAEIQSDDEIDAYIRQTAGLIYHPVGTCRMGRDTDAVVDGSLRVNGVQNLRVIDASVMPTVPGGHTNAPTIMIAEKMADVLRGRNPPPPADL